MISIQLSNFGMDQFGYLSLENIAVDSNSVNQYGIPYHHQVVQILYSFETKGDTTSQNQLTLVLSITHAFKNNLAIIQLGPWMIQHIVAKCPGSCWDRPGSGPMYIELSDLASSTNLMGTSINSVYYPICMSILIYVMCVYE